jgi:hypothetical protein
MFDFFLIATGKSQGWEYMKKDTIMLHCFCTIQIKGNFFYGAVPGFWVAQGIGPMGRLR